MCVWGGGFTKIRSPANAVTDWIYCPEAPGSPWPVMKIGQIEAVILTFEVPGSTWNFFLPGTSLFLPSGDMGGEIMYYLYYWGAGG